MKFKYSIKIIVWNFVEVAVGIVTQAFFLCSFFQEMIIHLAK